VRARLERRSPQTHGKVFPGAQSNTEVAAPPVSAKDAKRLACLRFVFFKKAVGVSPAAAVVGLCLQDNC
jgi:hypothetical protein